MLGLDPGVFWAGGAAVPVTHCRCLVLYYSDREVLCTAVKNIRSITEHNGVEVILKKNFLFPSAQPPKLVILNATLLINK